MREPFKYFPPPTPAGASIRSPQAGSVSIRREKIATEILASLVSGDLPLPTEYNHYVEVAVLLANKLIKELDK